MTTFPSPDEAAAHFAVTFQATVSCVTHAQFNYPQTHPLDEQRSLVLAGGDDVPLDNGLYLYAAHWYTVTGEGDEGFVVRTGAYYYTVNSDDQGGELFGWHWHPEGTSWCLWPHLHAPHPHGDHVPTGRTALEQVVRWLLMEMELQPARGDWEGVLDANETDYRERRSWA